ncbi:hypothetical protein XI06_15150 [Bradyrhizobium sp. CCBAU 11434]|uniref:hypothetical protein n=1 Tax=Bradyrhizobium sp. CCBAU 11434 TaxID=1630885 RepID=UPI002305CE72|nr:hypothetical protein [Bradyrhizobium sp. CCBAU 11434]MDA9521643.1 hypothetical protein [Bradyrhizobium sp. CCBAU 11434]
MTDLEFMLAMLERAKIAFERSIVDADLQHAGCTELVIERGYVGFVSCLYFDAAGALVSIEAYE